MYIAKYLKVKIPKEWEHDPERRDYYNKTVSYFLKENNKDVPDQWITNEDLREKD